MSCAPVLFQIFNRPKQTAQTFAALREAKPKLLLVVADGPREGRLGEAALCADTRNIVKDVDWPCDVLTNFSEINLGCGRRVASGFDWAFSKVDAAIILEDDCLPDPSFFRFSTELLERYRNDERVWMVSGNNFQNGASRTSDSYFFSRFPHCWGWATWRRAWLHYDFTMKSWPERRQSLWLRPLAGHRRLERYWTACFENTYNGGIDSWDYQWMYSMLVAGGLSAVPDVNLVTNIGFDEAATHTPIADERYNVARNAISFPLRHPEVVEPHAVADTFEKDHLYRLSSLTEALGPAKSVLARARLLPRLRELASRLRGRSP